MDAKPKRRRIRTSSMKLLLACVSLTFSLLVVEIAVRLTWSTPWRIPREAFAESDVFRFRLKPEFSCDVPIVDADSFRIVTNERGFRGPTVASIQECDLRIVSIGDSFTFGWGLPRTEHCMERWLDDFRVAHPDRQIGHAFVALPKWSPKDYYFAYLEEVRPLQADIVVLGVFPGNDLLERSAGKFRTTREAAEHGRSQPRPGKSVLTLSRWYTFDWMKAQIRATPVLANLAVTLGARPVEFERFARDETKQQELWDTSLFYLTELERAVSEDGGRLVMISYPSKTQFDSADYLNNEYYDPKMPDAVLSGFCERADTPFIALLSDLQESGKCVYWDIDRHMNSTGQAVAAATISKTLTPVVEQRLLAVPRRLSRDGERNRPIAVRR
ncbi:MAG: SGNH/GDSL hydrolase family protein [Planctomycetaceae bacterium]